MVNRVLLNESVFRVSKPGVDVLTAGKDQLNFSSEWSGLKLLVRGYVTILPGVTVTIPFGKDYGTNPPLCAIGLKFDNEDKWFLFYKAAGEPYYNDVYRIYGDRLTLKNSRSDGMPGYWFYHFWDYVE